jgi:hypothetical protein
VGALTDRVASGTSTDELVVSEAFATARELLRRAEDDAARLRADADRYVRQREQEAELLVGKARRLLEVAEQTAAAIESGAVSGRPLAPRHLRVDPPPASPAATVVLDLDAEAADSARQLRSDLDRLLADAIGRAFDRSFGSRT